jgi:hypothetical protein
MTSTTTPEGTVTDELPEKAWILVERPGQVPEVFAGSEAAEAEALTYCSTGATTPD